MVVGIDPLYTDCDGSTCNRRLATKQWKRMLRAYREATTLKSHSMPAASLCQLLQLSEFDLMSSDNF